MPSKWRQPCCSVRSPKPRILNRRVKELILVHRNSLHQPGQRAVIVVELGLTIDVTEVVEHVKGKVAVAFLDGLEVRLEKLIGHERWLDDDVPVRSTIWGWMLGRVAKLARVLSMYL